MARPAPRSVLDPYELYDRRRLERAPSTPQALAFRARLILRCAHAPRPTNDEVVADFGSAPAHVAKSRWRFRKHRLAGLADLPRSGRPAAFPPEERHRVVVLATTKPQDLGVPTSHWSLEDLAYPILQDAHSRDMSRSTGQRILAEADLKPPKSRYGLHSDDPEFEAKAVAICRLYLAAPRLYRQGQLVICTDEKTSIQALERLPPTKPGRPGQVEWQEFEYLRRGTRCLLASLVVATGQGLGSVTARRARWDFVRHVRDVVVAFPHVKRFHWVMDNLNTHWTFELCRYLARDEGEAVWQGRPKLRTGAPRRAFLQDPTPRHVIHYTPKQGSWLNQIEIWFGVLARRVLRRGEFRSVEELAPRIGAYIAHDNRHHAHPYEWTSKGKPLASGDKPKRKRRRYQRTRLMDKLPC